tara:strand:- start:187 stop:735 length:549 start_codon:yes stop_codon:yes gene_type:complete
MAGTLTCAWCQLPANVEECGGSQELHYETVVNILSDRLQTEHLSVRVAEFLFPLVFLGDGLPILDTSERFCHAACIKIMKTTRSGRKSRVPMRLRDANFVKGAGEWGCDQYDRGFDRGVHYDPEKWSLDYQFAYSKNSGFVVSDDEEEEDSESEPSYCEECWSEDDDETDEDSELEMELSDD